ncbi:MAG: GNAT family N-acetyltransferase [Flavobacteriaceae bacterium]|nr:GNAT family N-acetyltransferase [Flavobacteriaceae bacterium]
MKLEYTIRPAVQADMPYLLKFEQGVIEAERPMNPTIRKTPITYYDLEYFLSSADVKLLVVCHRGVPIASGYARKKTPRPYLDHHSYAYLGFMYVAPEHRGKGINKLLIEELKKWCKKENLLELRLDVYTVNEAAIKAYEKAGFTSNMLNMRMRLE